MMRITALRWVPKFAQGYVRDLRVRWACEEAGLPYDLRLIDRAQQASPNYRREQPFGQVPVLEDGNLTLFETGAILLHIGEKSEALIPKEAAAKARVTTWMFAALNSIEPFVQNLTEVDIFHSQEEWAKSRRPVVVEALKNRLAALNTWLDGRDYLEERFTVADLLMTTVLRDVPEDGVLEDFPRLLEYRRQGEARPGFRKALASQLKNFADNAPS